MLKRFPEYGRTAPAFTFETFVDHLRRLIVGRVHAGWLKPGDKLPSIRDAAERSQVDHRVAAAAYRALEREGLVEVRAKSGVYLSLSATEAAARDAGPAWAAEILVQAWDKHISRSALCHLFGGSFSSRLRCGVIESNEDHMVAFCAEIEAGLSIEVVPLMVDPDASLTSQAPDGIADVDVIVTSAFHMDYARAVGQRENKPVVILTLRPEFADEIGRRLSRGKVVAVVADPRYAQRGWNHFKGAKHAGEVEFLTVEQVECGDVVLDEKAMMVTRAARRRLGLADYHLLPTATTIISQHSARELCRVITELGMRQRPIRSDPRRMTAGAAGTLPVRSVMREDASDLDVQDAASLVEREVRQRGLFKGLEALNHCTLYRFTGIYRFEPGWVRSVLLYDRENPHLQVGADVPMKESYCIMTAHSGAELRIENASADDRLNGHAARSSVLSYCAVHLKDSNGASWGTLCHFDFRECPVGAGVLELLETVRPLIQELLGNAVPYVEVLPDCAIPKPVRRPARQGSGDLVRRKEASRSSSAFA